MLSFFHAMNHHHSKLGTKDFFHTLEIEWFCYMYMIKQFSSLFKFLLDVDYDHFYFIYSQVSFQFCFILVNKNIFNFI